jgi:hypothetical protein
VRRERVGTRPAAFFAPLRAADRQENAPSTAPALRGTSPPRSSDAPGGRMSSPRLANPREARRLARSLRSPVRPTGRAHGA